MKMQTNSYHGIRPCDPGGRDGLPNPERGWRLETLIAEPPGSLRDTGVHGHAHHLEGRIHPGYNDHWWELDAQRYAAFGLKVIQTYCYLDEFIGRKISASKLALLQQSLNRLRARGFKALLRFAYEKSSKLTRGPVLKDILRHLDQLAPVIRANADIIYVMQAGFIGAFGEWHSSARGLEKDHANLGIVLAKILDVLPTDRMTQVRVPKYKRWALAHPSFGEFCEVTAATAHTALACARIGHNNDGFLAAHTCGGTWPEPPFYSNPGNPEFDYLTRESPYIAVDGELYWHDERGQADGRRAIARMRLHHYGTFSLWHSYSGRVGGRYSIDSWMLDPLTADHVRNQRLPCSDGYFQDALGGEIPRTVFEYITDHLGYRFELQRAAGPAVLRRDERLCIELDLINRGFGVPHNPRPVFLALVDAAGRAHALPIPGADPRRWQPFEPGDETLRPLMHRLRLKAGLPASVRPGWYQWGLWLPDAAARLRLDPRYAMRLANRDTPWWTDDRGQYGINLLGVMEVTTARART